MKIQKNIKWAAAIAAVCLAAYSASAKSDYIGFKFVSNELLNGMGETTAPGGVFTDWTTNVDALAPTETAGVPPLCTQAHWMNLGMFGTNTFLTDSNGSVTPVNLSWYALGTFHAGNNGPGATGGNGAFPAPATNNNKLMDGFIECTWGGDQANVALPPGTPIYSTPISDQPLLFLTGLNAFLSGQGGGTYSVIIYVNTDGTGQGRVGQYYVDAAHGTSDAMVDDGPANSVDNSTTPPTITPTTHIFVSSTTQWNGSNWTMVPLTATNNANSAFGNYVEFDGLTNDTILIRTQNAGNPGAPICGIQILSLGVAIPPNTSTPAVSPTNTVYGNSTIILTESATGTPPITYQWQTDGGSGGALTNIIGANTNTLSVFMPDTGSQYTVKYTAILTNIYSFTVPPYAASTSLVCYVTVLPANAPILTTDVGGVGAGSVAVPYNTNVYAFIGGNVGLHAEFNLGTTPITNQWLVKLDSGGGITPLAGAASWYWTITNIQPAKAGNYELAATNSVGNAYSSSEHITPLADPPAPGSTGVTNMYANCIMTNHPWAYWKFEETNDSLTSSMQAYDYSGHNFDATYGNSDGNPGSGCKNGGESLPQLGPIPSGSYAGFPVNNGCCSLSYNHDNGYLYVPPLNLNTNTVTFTMWIYPKSSVFPTSTGLLMNRNGYDAAGIGFGTVTNGPGTPNLAYTWNKNSAATYGWNSGLYPVANVWNFVACTITPSNTVMYLYYAQPGNGTNLFKAVNNVINEPESFTGGTTWMGSDNWNNGHTLYGCIDEVAIFTNSLSESQLQSLFLTAIGLTSGIPPVITQQPSNMTVFQGQTLVLSALAAGIPTPATNGAGNSYQWQVLNGANWASLGTTLPTRLTTNATFYWQNFTGSYSSFRAIAKNASGSATSGVATVTYVPVANWNQGVWTVNFCVPSTGNYGPGTPYVGLGVLGTNTYWNRLSGGQMKNTPVSLRDDGVTPSGINVTTTNNNIGTYSSVGSPDGGITIGTMNNALLDQYCQIYDTNNGLNFFFTQVPKGIYNVALYGCTASYADRGVGFTVITNGVSAGTQWITNAQDIFLTPYDNTVVFTNLLILNGTLQVNAAIAMAVPKHTNSTEADFNGVQLELVKAGPDIWSITNSGTNLVLTWAGGGLMQSTNLSAGIGWVTNTAVSPFTFAPTGAQRFFKVEASHFP
jgi:hypothetical protein